MKYLALALVLGCAAPAKIPMALRPDTRRILVTLIDSAAAVQTAATFQAALPMEGSVCYRGALTDTTVVSLTGDTIAGFILHEQTAYEAQHDSLTDHTYQAPDGTWVRVMHVWYHDASSGCGPETIGIAHSHPMSRDVPCEHSVDDAHVVFVNTHIWVSSVWCGDGQAEDLYQDGRRQSWRWKP
jgi:hypothetical protein